MKWGSLDWGIVADEIDRKRVHDKILSELPPQLNLNQEGSYYFRVISNPFTYAVHWVRNAHGGLSRITCSDEDCEICKNESLLPEDKKINQRYSTFVLAASTLPTPTTDYFMYRLDLGKSVFVQLARIIKSLGDSYKEWLLTIERVDQRFNGTNKYASYNVQKWKHKKVDLTNELKRIESLSVPMKVLLGNEKMKAKELSDWIIEERILSKSW